MKEFLFCLVYWIVVYCSLSKIINRRCILVNFLYKNTDTEEKIFKITRVKKWKDRLPEFSQFKKNAFNKSKIKSHETQYLNLYKVELKKAISLHCIPLIFTIPLIIRGVKCFLINLAITIGFNYPFYLILKFNLSRIEKILKQHNKKLTLA